MTVSVRSFTHKTSIIAVLTAACVASNYIMLGIVNVKFMDLIVFIAGYVFGAVIGVSIGVLTWLVYGTLNPYGFSIPILIATASGESIYGLVGGLLGKNSNLHDHTKLTNNLKFAITGFLLTFIYDQYTNIVAGLSVGLPIHVALISGIPFSLIHEFSNAVFFFVGASPAISAIVRLFQGGS